MIAFWHGSDFWAYFGEFALYLQEVEKDVAAWREVVAIPLGEPPFVQR